MEFINAGKLRTCRHCKDNIYSFQARYKAVEGFYCVYDAKIKRLHDASIKWIRSVALAAL